MRGIAVFDLLDDGAWALAESLRVCEDARRLGDQTRDLLLTYRAHRLCMVSGGSGARVDGATTLRHLLQSAPGDALCDACLAFALRGEPDH